jgi:predicted PurR-regulated permease PerM
MLLVLGGLVALIVPPLVDQGKQLVNYVISLYDNREGIIGGMQDLANQYGLSGYLDTIQSQLSSLPARLTAAVGPLVSVTVGVVGSVYATITILLLTFFLILDGERFVAAILRLFAPAQRPRLRRILGQSAGAVSGYISGNLTISLIAGVATFVMLQILRVPYPVVLALIVAFLDLVPLVGATLGAIIVSAVGLFVDPVKGVILIVFFLVYQQIENNILQPLVYGRSVKLHPLAVFLAVLAGGELLGILGALLAIPVAEVIRILLSEWLTARRRGTNYEVRSTK